jgi:hypothetical protein
MSNPWAVKLARVDEHLATLGTEIVAYQDSDAATIRVKPLADGVSYDLVLSLSASPPERWSAVIGDILHNIRSALDSRTFDLVMSNSLSPLSRDEQRRVVFPITASRRQYESNGRWHGGKGTDALKAAFATVQPWTFIEDLEDPPSNYVEHDPLMVLQRLSNFDKHRSVHVTVCQPDMVYVGTPEGVTVEAQVISEKDGDVILRYEFSGGRTGLGKLRRIHRGRPARRRSAFARLSGGHTARGIARACGLRSLSPRRPGSMSPTSSRGPILFVAGARDGTRYSHVWRVWAHGTSFYIKPRTVALSSLKLSLHGPDAARGRSGGFKLALDQNASNAVVSEGGALIATFANLPYWFDGAEVARDAHLALRIRFAGRCSTQMRPSHRRFKTLATHRLT